jgi:hypothetical protein
MDVHSAGKPTVLLTTVARLAMMDVRALAPGRPHSMRISRCGTSITGFDTRSLDRLGACQEIVVLLLASHSSRDRSGRGRALETDQLDDRL